MFKTVINASATIGLIICIGIQSALIHKANSKMSFYAEVIRSQNKYIWESFGYVWRDSEDDALEEIGHYLDGSSVVVYLSSGLCRACFSSLIFDFENDGIEANRIHVIDEVQSK